MLYKKIISLASKFNRKIASSEDLTNPDGIKKPLNKIIKKDPSIENPDEAPLSHSPTVSVKKDHITNPGDPSSTQEEFAYEVSRYLRVAGNSIENDISSLKDLNFFRGRKEGTMSKDKIIAYKILCNLLDTIRSCNLMPLKKVYQTAEIFLKYMKEESKSIYKAAKIIHHFMVIENNRLEPIGFPTAINIYKLIYNSSELYKNNSDIINYRPDEYLNEDFLEPRIKIANQDSFRAFLSSLRKKPVISRR